MARLFVAVRPPSEVVALLSALDRPALPGVRWSVPAQWLVKLRPLGQVDARVVPALGEALAAELDGAPATACRLGPVTRRLAGQWLGVPVDGLDDLAAVVFEATEELVPVTHPQPFQADLVLARGRVPRELAGRPVSGSWTARSVSLVADRSAPGAVRFQELATYPLEDPPPGPG
jgi:2'-5' RNA ligase